MVVGGDTCWLEVMMVGGVGGLRCWWFEVLVVEGVGGWRCWWLEVLVVRC